HRFALDQFARLVELVVDDGAGIDADAVVDGGEELAGVDGFFDGGGGGLVGLAVDQAALDAGAGDDAGVAIGPVIAAVVVVVVAAGADAALRAAAELAHGYHQRFRQHAAL